MRAPFRALCLCLALLALVANALGPTSRPSPKPSPRPSSRPTLAPTSAQPMINGPGWIYSSYFESEGCTGESWKKTGNRLNVCLPRFSTGGYNHTTHQRIAVKTIGYYMYKSCVSGVSAVYEEYGSTDSTCAATPTLRTPLTGGCSKLVDPNDPYIFYMVSEYLCQAGDAIPTPPPNAVTEMDIDDCTSSRLVGFTSTTTTKCLMENANSDWTQIFMLSSSLTCDAFNVPQQIGYLGTHCTKRSNQISMPTDCTDKPAWSISDKATAWKYECVAPAAPAVSTGWLTKSYMSNDDCTGYVLSMKGTALGVCVQGFGNESIALGSTLTSCTETRVFDTPDCSGQYKTLPTNVNTCVPNANAFSSGRGGNNGKATFVSCTSQVDPLPMPFHGNSIVGFQYATDTCWGPAVSFTKYPQDSIYNELVLAGISKKDQPYTQLVSCATGQPILDITMGHHSGFTDYVQYLDTSCSFLDPANLADMQRYGPKDPENPKGLVFSRSQIFTPCMAPASAPPPPEDPLSFPPQSDHSRYGGAVAGVVIAVLIAVATMGGIYYWYTRYYVKSYGDALGLMGRRTGAMAASGGGGDAHDDIPSRGGGGGNSSVEFGTRRL